MLLSRTKITKQDTGVNSFANAPRHEIVKLHFDIIRVANFFLKQKTQFSIHELSEHDEPTYEQVAIDARFIAKMLQEISSLGVYSEERLAENASQAALFMERMALAISNDNQDALDTAAQELESMCLI
jgi:hypothetical protein